MFYGAILDKGEDYYTDLNKLFNSIRNIQNDFNWLVTNFECAHIDECVEDIFNREYCWLSGNELTGFAKNNIHQCIWGVLSGFEKHIPLGKVLEYPLPYADGYGGFWRNPVSIQHPLASIEIVPYDSSLILFISKQKEFVDYFMKAYPHSEDLSLNNKINNNCNE